MKVRPVQAIQIRFLAVLVILEELVMFTNRVDHRNTIHPHILFWNREYTNILVRLVDKLLHLPSADLLVEGLMSWEKNPEQLLGNLLDREQIHGLVEPRVPKPAKYKKERHDKGSRPDLCVGKRVIYPLHRDGKRGRSIAGYALGVVLDWSESGSRWWRQSDVIVQVTKVSNNDFECLVGCLRSITLHERGNWIYGGGANLLVPEEANPADFGL